MENDGLSVEELLEVLEDLLDNAKNAPFRSKVLIDRDAMYEVIKDIRLFLPNEIKQSKWVMNERNKLLVDAQTQADDMIKDTETKIAKMVTEHEITRRAVEEAERVKTEAEDECRKIRVDAMRYVDGLLVDLSDLFQAAHQEVKSQNQIIEQCYLEKMQEIYENRCELRETAK